MSATAPQIAELASNTTFCLPIWRMVALDNSVAAYCEGGIAPITFESVTYYPSVLQSARPSVSMGLEADSSDLRGAFDSFITKADVENGKWRGATVYRQILVNQLDLSLGSVRKQKGKVGSIEPLGESYKIEFQSLVSPLSQKIGDLTSNSDRIRVIEDLVDPTSFTHAATVTDVTDRRTFKVDYDAIDDTYFENGRAVWLTGANAGDKHEIKSGIRTDTNTKTEITMHIKATSTIVVGDTCSLIRGYVGTREDAVAIGSDAILNTQGEFDIPPESFLLRYPE